MPEYTNNKPFKTTTRNINLAMAIRDRVPFDTGGSLMGRTRTTGRMGGIGGPWGYGSLSGVDLAWAREDDAQGQVDYVVWSYSTPIAWHMAGGLWHRVGQTFSPTTSKHQGNLYLIDRADHRTSLRPLDQTRGVRQDRWAVDCDTCGSVVSLHRYKSDAAAAAHTHRIAGRYGIVPSASTVR